jgi:hypothetical protein
MVSVVCLFRDLSPSALVWLPASTRQNHPLTFFSRFVYGRRRGVHAGASREERHDCRSCLPCKSYELSLRTAPDEQTNVSVQGPITRVACAGTGERYRAEGDVYSLRDGFTLRKSRVNGVWRWSGGSS